VELGDDGVQGCGGAQLSPMDRAGGVSCSA
jgi:hypothetical protein